MDYVTPPRIVWPRFAAAGAAVVVSALLAAGGCASAPTTLAQETIPSPHGFAEASLKTTPELSLVYRQVEGPYPDIGSSVDGVRSYALATAIPYPILHVIYYDDPVSVDPRVARSDVGFERPEKWVVTEVPPP